MGFNFDTIHFLNTDTISGIFINERCVEIRKKAHDGGFEYFATLMLVDGKLVVSSAMLGSERGTLGYLYDYECAELFTVLKQVLRMMRLHELEFLRVVDTRYDVNESGFFYDGRELSMKVNGESVVVKSLKYKKVGI